MDSSFALITEGITDQAIIEQILFAHFDNPDLDIRPLQPKRTANNKTDGFGSWTTLFKFCFSDDFKQVFDDVDFVVLQIDTDICHYAPFDMDAQRSGESVKEFILRVQERFIQLWDTTWGESFCQQYFHRILFAVAVQSAECWLMPLYANAKKQSKTANCLGELEKALKRNIPKEYKVYSALAKPYREAKNKTKLPALLSATPSLDFFIYRELHIKLCYHQITQDS